jgi:hypothetical protein
VRRSRWESGVRFRSLSTLQSSVTGTSFSLAPVGVLNSRERLVAGERTRVRGNLIAPHPSPLPESRSFRQLKSLMGRGRRNHRNRSGLAPLELVLVLPVLMMVAGLMLFVANAGVWKLRAHAGAREAAFQSVHPRQTAPASQPPEWQRPELTYSIAPGPTVWSVDPLENHPLLRGPNWPPLTVNSQLLDGSQGMMIGQAQSAVPSGLWPQMRVNYRFQRKVFVLGSHQWQYDSMGIPGHGARRSIPLWNLEF